MTDGQSGYQLAHPVYLDVAMMISFLAYLEGGVSTQEESTQREVGAREKALKGRAGIRARLPWALDAEAASEASSERREEVTTESKSARQHTAASLFNLLYQYLCEDNQIVDLLSPEQLVDLRPGQLVQFSGEYLGNPLEDILAFLSAVYPYVTEQQESQKKAVAGIVDQTKRATRSGSPATRTQAQQAMPVINELVVGAMQQLENSQNQMGIQLMLRMAEDISDVPVHDLLIRLQSGLQVVLTVSSEYFSPETNEYLREGEFRVVGKVTKVVTEQGSINLTRRTVLGAADPSTAQELVETVKSGEVKLNVADPIVHAPAVQILPMAIFI